MRVHLTAAGVLAFGGHEGRGTWICRTHDKAHADGLTSALARELRMKVSAEQTKSVLEHVVLEAEMAKGGGR